MSPRNARHDLPKEQAPPSSPGNSAETGTKKKPREERTARQLGRCGRPTRGVVSTRITTQNKQEEASPVIEKKGEALKVRSFLHVDTTDHHTSATTSNSAQQRRQHVTISIKSVAGFFMPVSAFLQRKQQDVHAAARAAAKHKRLLSSAKVGNEDDKKGALEEALDDRPFQHRRQAFPTPREDESSRQTTRTKEKEEMRQCVLQLCCGGLHAHLGSA